MISFYSETDFELKNKKETVDWIVRVIKNENKSIGDINFIFCDDSYLLKINQEYLNHDTFTDIISFDYTVGNILQGDIYISVERVGENATNFDVDFNNELARVMIHGILHFCGYNDKTDSEKKAMRAKEDYHLNSRIEIQ